MWLIKLNAITNVLAFIIGLVFYKKFSIEIKTIFYFVAFGVFTETFMRFYQHYVTKNVMPVGHFYFPIAFLIAGIFYVQALKGYVKPKYLWASIITFELYCVINSVLIQGLFEYPSLVGSVGAMLVFLFSVLFFIKVMLEAKILKLFREPLIWINTAFLIYYTFNFFYHSTYNLRFKASVELSKFAVIFFSAINLLFYAILAVAFLMARKDRKSN